MDVSVIIPFYNAAPTIERCIQGLLAQDLPPERFEILMVDNNSTDASAAIVRRYPRVTLLREPKQGAYAARNRGLAHARGRILAFTDPDCVPRPDWLRHLEGAFEAQARQIVMGRNLPPGASTAMALLGAYRHHKDRYIFTATDPTVYYGHTNNLAARHETMEALGPFVECRRGADVVFVRRTVERYGCDAVTYEPRAQVEHLEVADLATFYRKNFTYGRSWRTYRRIIPARPLRPPEQVAIYLRAVHREGLGPVAAARLLLMLGLGVACWHAGALLASRPPTDSLPTSP